MITAVGWAVCFKHHLGLYVPATLPSTSRYRLLYKGISCLLAIAVYNCSVSNEFRT